MQFAADSCILGGAAGRPAAPAAQKRTRRGIEVVITGAPRKRFGSNPTWVRIPPSPPKQRAHAAHGPSALLLDRWDSKGGTEKAAVRHFPAPGSDGPQLCSLEGKQQEASAENPTLCFAFGQVGFEGRNRKCRSAAFSRPGSLAPPRWSPVPGASPRPGENGRGNRSGQRADAPRERRGERERQRLAPKHPFHPLQIRSASRVTSFQASPANRRGSRPPRSPR